MSDLPGSNPSSATRSPIIPNYEPAGLICAFRFADSPESLRWNDVVTHLAHPHAPLWIHVKVADSRVQHWLRETETIPTAVREFLLSGDLRPALRITADGIYGTLVDMDMDVGGADAEKGTLHFFLDQARMITVRTRALQSTDRLRRTIRDGADFATTAELFTGLITCMADGFAEKIETLTDQVDNIEQSVLSDRQPEDRGALSSIRRQLAELRRYINPERNALNRLAAGKLPWIEAEHMHDMLQSVETLNGIGTTLDALYERAKLLQEEISAQMSEEMNRNLLVLSVLTALLMPATLVSGIFGMNVAGLPGLHGDTSFWWVIAMMLGLGLATLALLRRLKLLM